MIDSDLARFLGEGLAIHIGTRDDRLRPDGARATAVSVEPDGAHLLIYVPEVAASRVLPNLEATGQAAVVFARPIDDRACQIKGVFVSARPATPDEQPAILEQWEAFRVSLERIGVPRMVSEGWRTWPSVAVRLRVTALFDQTPGPRAGAPLT